MMNWQLQEAKSKFSYVVNQALQKGPQIITRHGKEVVVIMSMDEYRKITKPHPFLIDLLLDSPLVNSDIDIDRDKNDFGRDVSL